MSDPFAILNLPRSFELTPTQVAAAHLKIAAQVHPDRARNPIERDEFMRKSAEAGQAKHQLMSDLGRAEALLAVLGVPMSDVQLPPAFLAQTLELRERIEEASGETGGLALNEIRADAKAARAECVAELSAALKSQDGVAARGALARLRYTERMLTRLSDGS